MTVTQPPHRALPCQWSPCDYVEIIAHAQVYFKVTGLLLDPLLNVFVQRQVGHILYHILTL